MFICLYYFSAVICSSGSPGGELAGGYSLDPQYRCRMVSTEDEMAEKNEAPYITLVNRRRIDSRVLLLDFMRGISSTVEIRTLYGNTKFDKIAVVG